MKLLIPLAFINEACDVSLNIDEKSMRPNLEESQTDLRAILGVEFYEEIETQYAPQNDTLTSDNSELYEGYIKYFLAWQSYYYSMGFGQSQSTPTGEREFTEPNSAILSDVKLYAKERNIQRRANKYKNEMINFLRLEQGKDSTNYPLWKDRCMQEFGFGISSVGRDTKADIIVSINKAVQNNE